MRLLEQVLVGITTLRRLIRRIKSRLDASISIRRRYCTILDNMENHLRYQETVFRDILQELPLPNLDDEVILMLDQDAREQV